MKSLFKLFLGWLIRNLSELAKWSLSMPASTAVFSFVPTITSTSAVSGTFQYRIDQF